MERDSRSPAPSVRRGLRRAATGGAGWCVLISDRRICVARARRRASSRTNRRFGTPAISTTRSFRMCAARWYGAGIAHGHRGDGEFRALPATQWAASHRRTALLHVGATFSGGEEHARGGALLRRQRRDCRIYGHGVRREQNASASRSTDPAMAGRNGRARLVPRGGETTRILHCSKSAPGGATADV